MARTPWKRYSKGHISILAALLVFTAGLVMTRTVLPQEQAPQPGATGCRSFEQSDDFPGCQVPAEYGGKHMPKGGWTNPEIIAKGEVIFQAICGVCHGPEGKPKLVGARNFSDA